jgi:hypothetical protein
MQGTFRNFCPVGVRHPSRVEIVSRIVRAAGHKRRNRFFLQIDKLI